MGPLRLASLLVAAACTVAGCGSDVTASPFDSLPQPYREMARDATGFEREALADGRVTREEMVEGVTRQATCLSELGFEVAGDRDGQLVITGTAPSDAQFAACAEGNSQILPLVYSLIAYGSPDVQRQRQIDCFVDIGVLPADVTPQDFEELHDEKIRGVELSSAESNCLAAAIP